MQMEMFRIPNLDIWKMNDIWKMDVQPEPATLISNESEESMKQYEVKIPMCLVGSSLKFS